MNDRPSVLYIDDDEGLGVLTRRALGRRGYEVEVVTSGAEGIAKAAEGGFDLVTVDHYMPGQDGLETMKQIRALPDAPPVIYVTGSEESRIAVAALKAGAIDYVVKAASDDYFDLLASAIAQALNTQRLEQAAARSADQLAASNQQLQVLLREVNHRVANSLQLVTAFVQLQARSLPDQAARAALEDTQRRISAIAQVHRRLYTSDDVETVAMDEYLASLVEELGQTWSTSAARRDLKLFAEPVRLSTDRAVAVGVIVNELISNACKYAYAADRDGEIRVRLRSEDDGRFELRVEDDGCGMPADGSIKGTGLGSKLIRSMANSLGSTLAYVDEGVGTKVTMSAAC
ncbi:two-component sensor histidine kinase/CheY-like chemotaxis protein [Sphingomonas vulcanisoli]|uniref:histidine kinase n=1 Tax=Sphingomonas vulcanisoli TaxID=1658060 RepID=A0ABX0TNH6_9SPHN|nr:histidine kinase dimerization/phosphoacceptor domain -containing protein [Sphingomonas vulcanisoli]NIJ07073.1 two-component sensor histidine kinase/CheY-like chemotaxis protein [Sphingomonas vulcanisoli]